MNGITATSPADLKLVDDSGPDAPRDRRYPFEKIGLRHGIAKHRDLAADDLERLLARLDLKGAERQAILGDPLASGLLGRFCVELPMNIAWYEGQIRKGQLFQRLWLATISVVSTAVVVLVAVPELLPFEGLRLAFLQRDLMGRMTVLGSAAFAVLRGLSFLGDHKSRINIFWRASADLKEALYTFEDAWRGKVFEAPGKLHPELVPALQAVLRSARTITRDERSRFFDALLSTRDLVSTRSPGT